MPKIPDEYLDGVNDAEESGGFDILPVGEYVVQLKDLDDAGEGPKGPYWTWKFATVEKFHPDHGDRWLYYVTSMAAPGMVKSAFKAFGYTPDSDTDEIIDDPEAYAVVKVSHRTWEGEKRANVSRISPFAGSKFEKKLLAAVANGNDDGTF